VVAAPDGSQVLRDSLAAPVAAAALLGMGLAARLMAAGARDLLGAPPPPSDDGHQH
jgi:hypothetical protein